MIHINTIRKGNMKTQEQIRIHRFHNQVAVSTPDTEQLYFDADDALALARELTRFAKNAKTESRWITTRIVKNGKARNEFNGKAKVEYI